MTVKRSNMFHITRIKKYRFGKYKTENTKIKDNYLNVLSLFVLNDSEWNIFMLKVSCCM